ncbi:tail fiber protein / tail tubular protein A [Providencia phage PSTRCR_120]|uniref:Tail fiber protein / tail tubular protein A n=1 Tax=Providencia phage PSTRCR_120 TaxID=2800826 RepID=A0A7T6ZLZ3_9CAUD|nr:tail fiber protein / tail tubular protein A [Providencia phage PSTRCR_120]
MSLNNDLIGLYGSIDSSDELTAVNDILEVIGQSPVNSLRNQRDLDVSTARRILASENKRVQSKGWGFNTEENTELSPDVFSGVIAYSHSYLRMLDPQGLTIYVNRDGRVYDTQARTDRFNSSIFVDLVVARSLSVMPVCFRELIVCTAAARFNSSRFGDQDVARELSQRIMEARVDIADYEADFGRYNILEDEFLQGMMRR